MVKVYVPHTIRHEKTLLQFLTDIFHTDLYSAYILYWVGGSMSYGINLIALIIIMIE